MKILKALGVSLLIASGSMMLVAMYLFFTLHYSGGFSKNDSSIVHVIISGKDFYIPKSYIWAPVKSKNGHATGVNMEAVLPDFTPVISEREEFKLKIGILVHASDHHIGHDKAFELLLSDTIKDLGENYGLKIALLKRRYLKEELYFKSEEGKIEYFAVCSKDGSVVKPSCTSTFWIDETIYARYHFPKTHLHQWQTIEQDVEKFITYLMKKKIIGNKPV